MPPFRFTAPVCLRTCALLLTLLCARAHAQATPASVTIVGTFQSELGCPGDWDPACTSTGLDPHPVDGIWRKVFPIPGGPQEFKVALNGTWDENYGANAQRDGANLYFGHIEESVDVKFFYDPVSHWVTNSSLTPIAVLAGSLQTEVGCPSDWDPACMLTWLKDIDGDGVQELRIPSLPAGTYELKVAHHESWAENYGQDGEFNGANIGFTVPAPGQPFRFLYDTSSHRLIIHAALPTTTTLTVSPNPARPIDEVTLTAVVTVTGDARIPTGKVTFKVDGAKLGTAAVGPDGVATLTASPFPSGTSTLTAEYSGLDDPSVSLPVVLQTGYQTTTALTVKPGSATAYGEQVTLEASVTWMDASPGPAWGNVVFLSGDTELGLVPVDELGRASLSLNTLGAGVHALTARFDAQTPFLPSLGQASHTVNRAATEVLIGSDGPHRPLGLPITFHAEVSHRGFSIRTPSGSVTFQAIAGGITQELGTSTLDGQGNASLVVMGLPIHTYAVTATYSGDDGYLAATSPVFTQVVTLAETRTVITVSPATSVYGQPVDIRVEVRPEVAAVKSTPTGQVRLQSYNESEPWLEDFLTLDAEGRASLRTPLPEPGEYAVASSYNGDSVFRTSTSNPFVVTVLRGASQVVLESSRNPSESGQAVTLVARVSAAPPAAGIPGGSVTFRDGTHELATVSVNAQGSASYTTAPLEPGEYGLTAAYSGDTRFEPKTSAAVTQVVRVPEAPDAGTGGADAGTGGTDAGSGDTDAGSGDTDAGTGDTDAGTGGTDAGTGDTDAGTTPGNDAGTQGPDAGTGNTDAGTSDEPLPGEESGSGCGCGAGTGGSPLLLLGMWLGLTVVQSRRRATRQPRG